MIAVVVPAHNEEAALPECLAALAVAAKDNALAGEPVAIFLILDACTDGSAAVCRDAGVEPICVAGRNVGRARAAGCAVAIAAGARWIACTDADTRVAPDWLSVQLALRADVVCGTIGVDDWHLHGALEALLRHDFDTTYRDVEGHRHVHAANLGFTAQAYCAAGGFSPLASGEDIALVDAFVRAESHIAWSALPRVMTSARSTPRAQGGFGDAVLAAAMKLTPSAPR